MFGRSHRFHGYTSLQSVYRRGETVRGPLLSLKYASRNPGKPYRVGVVVGKKVSKSAVVRNRIRRRVFEVLQAQLGKDTGSFDIVITIYDEQLAGIEHKKLVEMVRELLLKAKIQ